VLSADVATMKSERCEVRISIPKDHPALPGHFPGTPVVPGVVLLDELLSAAERQLGRRLPIAGLPQVKFLAPLLPAEEAYGALEIDGARLTFRVERAGELIARGSLTRCGTAPAEPSR
jgi:3-hydroxyacyl-[acyl-carrier-protein] dehydratase